MKCHEVQELLSAFWDLPEDDADRIRVENHLEHCAECTQQFKIWEESQQLILKFTEESDIIPGAGVDLSRNVMDRIYAESAWMMPVNNRTYSFSLKLRRNLSALIACFMAIFLSSFLYLMVMGGTSDADRLNQLTEMMPTVIGGDMSISADLNLGEIPVASIGDPPVLNVVPTYPHYWIALSLLGITFSLLVLNWLARVRR